MLSANILLNTQRLREVFRTTHPTWHRDTVLSYVTILITVYNINIKIRQIQTGLHEITTGNFKINTLLQVKNVYGGIKLEST